MVNMCAFIGMTIGSALGWWLGEQVGVGTAIVVSGIGAGAGFYYGRKMVKDMFD